MPLSESLVAYQDIEKVMDKAIESPHGVIVRFDTYGKAVSVRQRCYKFRFISPQKVSEIAFTMDDPLEVGTSTYDALVVRF